MPITTVWSGSIVVNAERRRERIKRLTKQHMFYIWNIIATFSHPDDIRSIDRLCKTTRGTRAKQRKPRPICYTCGKEAFVPVKYNLNGVVCQKSVHCLRCIRSDISKQLSTHTLKNLPWFRTCYSGCCREQVYRNYWDKGPKINYKMYGNLPRKGEEVPHKNEYNEMDRLLEGNVICDKCKKNCGSVMESARHIKVCPMNQKTHT